MCETRIKRAFKLTLNFYHLGVFKVIKQHTTIPVYVMIRPRGGDFLYSDLEYDVMRKDIESFKENGADGFVFGILEKYEVLIKGMLLKL